MALALFSYNGDGGGSLYSYRFINNFFETSIFVSLILRPQQRALKSPNNHVLFVVMERVAANRTFLASL